MKTIKTTRNFVPLSAVLPEDRALCDLNYDGDMAHLRYPWVRLCAPVTMEGRDREWHDIPAGARVRLAARGNAATFNLLEVEV